MNLIRSFITGLLALILLSSCGGSTNGVTGSVSTNYPHLKSRPQVTYSQSSYNTSKYDVTITLEADGPDGVYAINLWIQSSAKSDFASLDLQYVGGTTWQITTNPLLPMPPGDYYLDSILVEDADSFANTIVKSSWYIFVDPSASHYVADQRTSDWNAVDILTHQVGPSDIPVVRFTLPPI